MVGIERLLHQWVSSGAVGTWSFFSDGLISLSGVYDKRTVILTLEYSGSSALHCIGC